MAAARAWVIRAALVSLGWVDDVFAEEKLEKEATTAAPKEDTPAVKHPKPKKKRTKKKKSDIGFEIDVSNDVRAGYLSGRTYRALPGGVVEAGVDATPAYRTKDFTFEAPLMVEHAQTTSPLVQSRGRAAVEIAYRRFPLFRPSAGIQASGVARPDWPDYYQPILSTQSDDDRMSTSRYSYYQRKAQAEVASNLGGGHHLRFKYQYVIRQFRHDPNFQPIERPMHLTPGDTLEHRGQVGWRWFFGKNNVAVSNTFYLRDYLYRFSRDAGTGATHAGPGGAPPNPLQQLWGVSPTLNLKWQLGPDLEIRPALGVTFNADTFDNYYTWLEWSPGLRGEWRASKKVVLQSSASATLRRYTSSGYQAASNHPPLDFGQVRQDDRYKLEMSASFRLSPHFDLGTEVQSIARHTNFPDYIPGVHPQNARYHIDWDYKIFSALLQLTYHLK